MSDRFSTGILLISLDFELYWGVRDKRSLEAYGTNLRNARQAVIEILALFEKYEIHATWSTVGFLFLNSRDEITDRLPQKLPGYTDENLCPYHYLQHREELEPDVHFAPSLIEAIARTPGQEVGSHTFSHFYCLEDGVSRESFAADLKRACESGESQSLSPMSLVFPRNQWREDFLPILSEEGFICFRGVEAHPIYTATSNRNLGYMRRGLKLLDSYLNLTGDHVFGPRDCGSSQPYNLPASRFLRPYSRKTSWLDPLKRRRILSSLRKAARNRSAFHLWWHPHNFGKNLKTNLDFLESILMEYRALQEDYDLRSLTMKEMAEGLETGSLLSDS